MKILSLDLECANTYCYRSICEIGAVVADGSFNVLRKIDELVNPRVNSFHTGSISFPYTIKELKAYPDFAERSEELFQLFDGDTLVLGHSLHNDISMLVSACRYYNLKLPPFRYIDSNVLLSAAKGKYEEKSLGAAAEEFGIEFEAHNPCDDAAVTLEITKKLLENESAPLPDFMQKHGIEFGYVDGGLMLRPISAYMSEKTLYKSKKVNDFYRFIREKCVDKAKKVFAIDKNLVFSYNLEPLAERMLAKGIGFCDDRKIADVYVAAKVKDDKSRAFDDLLAEYFPERSVAKTKRALKDEGCPSSAKASPCDSDASATH